jgi:hypothetical protein
MLEGKTRRELIGEVIRHLDSAAGEARETGPQSVAESEYIEEVLIPFVETEQRRARSGLWAPEPLSLLPIAPEVDNHRLNR